MQNALIFFETYGCSANAADSQIMAGLLTRAGYEIVRDIEKADLIIINTCSVKAATVSKIMFRLGEVRKNYPKKPILVAGCLPSTEPEEICRIDGLHFIGTESIKSVTQAVSDILDGSYANIENKGKEDKLCLPKMRDNSAVDIVPICSGCASACTFCSTHLARGAIFSYPKDRIISEIESARGFGIKEFWITGQDVSAYGLDEKDISQLPALMECITSNIPGKYFLRMGMMNPSHISKISNELLRAYRSDKIFKFLHLPVQSGNDNVLKKMNRQHTANDFIEIVEKFRRHYPQITIWTDIITGFPGEGDENFSDTINMIEETRPDFVNISQFSCHSKTPAAKMKQVPSEKKKERSSLLTEIADKIALENSTKWVGWKGEALVDEFKKEKGRWIARNFAYKPIVLSSARRLVLGEFVNVEITGASETCLFGKVVV